MLKHIKGFQIIALEQEQRMYLIIWKPFDNAWKTLKEPMNQ
jgi:hypothetical protein